ncbi:MAG TPA: L-seryl-tRNA(Sec) selenium transferase [Gemmatimonadales bacterium]|nr:L-seryl-tRNA(Sec) selenium transferase [Gemmatimonadales bacterium]
MSDWRSQLPSVDRLLRDPEVAGLAQEAPRNVIVAAVRRAIDQARRRRRGGPPEDWGLEVREQLRMLTGRSLRPAINATGVVLHTNLGRAPLARAAWEAMRDVALGYSTLEYDLATGVRGHRADHCRGLLAELSGAADGLVVNNAAGALVLALNALAGGGRGGVLISRGELIEIGGSFRIPEIVEKSGVALHEVGTTNRTHLHDYERALPQAAAILTVHRSNFEQRGFVHSPAPSELAALARQAGVPYIYDIGSGLLADLTPYGLSTEPRVQDAVAAGADLVIFSADKLLGGPQAGCLVGTAAAVGKCRSNPLARALRADKFTLAALEATLRLYRDDERPLQEIPVLSMLSAGPEVLVQRAERLRGLVPPSFAATLVPTQTVVGGGAFPGTTLPGFAVSLAPGDLGANWLALHLRLADPAVITRVEGGRVLLDTRTLSEGEVEIVGRVLHHVLEEQ